MTNPDQARIQLALAIGWTRFTGLAAEDVQYWLHPDDAGKETNVELHRELPNPFTDANDDYAVLEWAKERAARDPGFWQQFVEAYGPNRSKALYNVGDNARAALKVLNGGENDSE